MAGRRPGRTLARVPRMAAGTPQDVLIAGGGVGALETALALRARSSAVITLLAPARHFTYRFVDGEVIRARRLELLALARREGLAHLRDALDRVDVPTRTVFTQEGLALGYGALVLAVGPRRADAVP